MQLCSAIVTVQTYYNYFINLFIYLRKCVLQHLSPSNSVNVWSVQSALVPCVIILQLCPNEIGRCPFPTQCTSTVLTHTTVLYPND